MNEHRDELLAEVTFLGLKEQLTQKLEFSHWSRCEILTGLETSSWRRSLADIRLFGGPAALEAGRLRG